eukprot:6820523-Alexandrium_andersonii.AAC.1
MRSLQRVFHDQGIAILGLRWGEQEDAWDFRKRAVATLRSHLQAMGMCSWIVTWARRHWTWAGHCAR